MRPRVAAHLIVGAQEEPFLPALLRSLEGVAETLIVNDNAAGPSAHERVFAESAFAARGALAVDRTPFSGFADARNVCLRLHRERDAGEWIAFIDADEVHGELARTIVTHLESVPKDIGALDAYTWHFFASFDWYTSIERRLMLFRFTPEVRWEGGVHERLVGLPEGRMVLPYVYGHYGHTLEVRRHAEKGRLYKQLGGPGECVPEERLDSLDAREYFARQFPRLLRFRGDHAAAVQPTLAMLRPRLRELHELTENLVRAQALTVKVRNAIRYVNYEQRWRLRVLNPAARRLVSS